MISIVLILSFMGALVSSVPSNKMLYDLNKVENHFEQFTATFKKEYKNDLEKKSRFNIFKNNLKLINEKNTLYNESATFGVNQFADMTPEEFRMTYLSHMPEAKTPCTVYQNFSLSQPSAPLAWDWRQKNFVTRVKYQQPTCQSCWAFSTTGNLEGQYAKKYGKLQEFSEQQLVDCTPSNYGCYGGWMSNAIVQAIRSGGIMGERDYPYKAVQGQCLFNPKAVRARITNCYDLKFKSEEELKGILVENGPIAFALDATDLQLYSSGILQNCERGQVNHAMLLVGYGIEKNIPYWIIKNSWSEKWGDRGYLRVRLGENTCNMLTGPFTTGEVA